MSNAPSGLSGLNGKLTVISSYFQLVSYFSYFLFYYLLLHTLFYGLEQLHYNFCTPCGFTGFITSIFTSRSSMCKALRTISWHASDASANVMYAGISLLGSMLTMKATSRKYETIKGLER